MSKLDLRLSAFRPTVEQDASRFSPDRLKYLQPRTVNLMRHFVRLLLAAPAVLLASCAPQVGSSSPAPRAASPVSHDINALGRLITLPRRPQSVAWQQAQMGDGSLGPSDFSLRAVMRFSAADLKRIAHEPSIEAAPPHAEAEVEPWFPDALKRKARRNADGKMALRCARLVPDAFFKNSLIHGDLWQPEGTSYVILSLFTS